MEKIFIIDAVNFLFRSYYAIGPMTNDKGQSTGALYGFIRSVQKIIRDFSPSHLVCVFDGPENKKSRQQVYSEYKMHRKGAPEDLFPQFDLADQFCHLAGIATLCVEGVEADDTMATIALWAEKKGAHVYLCSSDKDLMQLVNDQIVLLQLHKENLIIDTKKVEDLFGVKPSQMLDLLAIMGDSSDNIPGLPGFGPKTAASLLQEFGSLDEILAHPEKVKGEKKQETIRSHKDTALMSRTLATLNTEIEIPKNQDFYKLKPSNIPKISEFYHEMKFNSLLRELGSEPEISKKKKQYSNAPEYTLIDTKEALQKLLKIFEKQSDICIDTETTSISPLLAELVGIGFGYEPTIAWYVPLNFETQPLLFQFFQTTSCAFFGHNIKYDLHVLRNLGIHLKKISFDTLLASYLLQPHQRKHNLDDLSLEKYKKIKIPITDLIGKGKDQISMDRVPVEKVKEYCCEDVDYTCRLKIDFEEELKENNLTSIFEQIELPLLPILTEMERVGIFLDETQIHEVSKKLNQDLEKLKQEIFQEVGEEFNLNSPKQLATILFEKLKLPAPKKISTSADVLETLAPEYPVVQHILEYRVLEKLRSTYAESLPSFINPKTKRIHCTFNQSGTATGRLACQDPNLQNIPIRSPIGMEIRSCFKPKKGWSFLGADYSQIELRLLAHFSEDPELLKAFQSKGDIHTHTASLIFDIPAEQVTESMRQAAKTVNFGIIYGQSPFGLSQQLGIPVKEASTFIKKYFERYPKISDFLDLCKESAKKTGAAKTLLGRKRPIPEISNKNPMIRAAAERLAINTPLQGTAADLIKLAMIEIDKEIRKRQLRGKMILQIHDELIFEIPDDEISEFTTLVKEKMETVLKLKIPIEVHIAIGKNWAEC